MRKLIVDMGYRMIPFYMRYHFPDCTDCRYIIKRHHYVITNFISRTEYSNLNATHKISESKPFSVKEPLENRVSNYSIAQSRCATISRLHQTLCVRFRSSRNINATAKGNQRYIARTSSCRSRENQTPAIICSFDGVFLVARHDGAKKEPR